MVQLEQNNQVENLELSKLAKPTDVDPTDAAETTNDDKEINEKMFPMFDS